MSTDVKLIGSGLPLSFLQVCARNNLHPRVVEAAANRLSTPNTSGGWAIENAMPVVCPEDPDRIHYTLHS